MTAERVHEYRVEARNPARESENRIHSDDVARRYGFAGGLVPGVTVYAYATAPILEVVGAEWMRTGGARLRFVAPCYDGEAVSIRVEEADPGQYSVLAGVGERRCASGRAGLDSLGEVEPASDPVPWGPLPESRAEATEDFFSAGRVLGSIELATDRETTDRYLSAIAEPSPVYADQGWVHPGWLLNGANWVLVANTVLPAWLHVESAVRYLRAVAVGEALEVRARIASAFERKGHRFVVLDVAWVAGTGPEASEVVSRARHTAIWRLAGS